MEKNGDDKAPPIPAVILVELFEPILGQEPEVNFGTQEAAARKEHQDEKKEVG